MSSTPSSSREAELEFPFPGASGLGLRVAVIDSGVNPRHPHICGVAGGASVFGPGDIEEDSFVDMLGHGTAVMAAIQEKAPRAEYLAVKLFHDSLRTSSAALIAAIEWSLSKEVHVINLSLGTLNFEYESRFRSLVESAASHGTSLVAAREANGQSCLPGSLPGVIGIGLDWDCPRNRYYVKEAAGSSCYYASGYPRSLPGVSPQRNLHGISFAVANMTGFVIRARESFEAEDLPAALAAEVGITVARAAP